MAITVSRTCLHIAFILVHTLPVLLGKHYGCIRWKKLGLNRSSSQSVKNKVSLNHTDTVECRQAYFQTLQAPRQCVRNVFLKVCSTYPIEYNSDTCSIVSCINLVRLQDVKRIQKKLRRYCTPRKHLLIFKFSCQYSDWKLKIFLKSWGLTGLKLNYVFYRVAS
jgi:hypothetical protein